MLRGLQSTMSSTSAWIQINQAKPHEPSWKLWRKVCALWSLNGKLYEPMGRWLFPANQLRRKWPMYYDHDTGDLYVRQNEKFARCVPIDAIRFSPISEVDWNPSPTSIPVHARQAIYGNEWIPLIPPTLPTPGSSTLSETFQEFITTLDLWERELFPELSMTIDCYEFLEIVNEQELDDTDIRLLTVSDGSDVEGSMSFGWIIALPSGRRLARCSGPAFGPSGSSFRAEGYRFPFSYQILGPLVQILRCITNLVCQNAD